MLNRKMATLIVAGLLLGAGGANAAEPAVPGSIDEAGGALPSQSTYADQPRDMLQRIPGTPGTVEPAYAGNSDDSVIDVAPKSTYADEHRGTASEVQRTRTGSPKLYSKD